MDSKQLGDSWTEDVSCSICVDLFTDPVSLECGHSFCRSCITQTWEYKGINSCPVCGTTFPTINLRGNLTLASLAKKAQKLSLNPQEWHIFHCVEHQEELKLFCETDKKLICRDSRHHKSHNFMPIKEAVEMYKDRVKSSLASHTEKKWVFLGMEQQQKQKISKIKEESSRLQTHIKFEFVKMHQIFIEKEQSLIQDIREQEANILKTMEQNLVEIQDNLNSLQEQVSKLEEQLEQKNEVIFLKEETSWKTSINEEGKTLSVTDGILSTEKFDRLLPFPVWKEMLDAIKPVSVTLDVETANPELEVSEDLKSLGQTEIPRSLPDTWKRFTDWFRPCALGSEGFTSGRHYWVVEVMGNQCWSLGVAAESVERKRRVSLNPENGFWIIWRDWNQFYVNFPEFTLPVNQVPRNVGVYLSYESGTVSFYNADTKSHLYTFTGNKFTEKLYPFFMTWLENQFLRICSGWI
ncbi:zinc-binding protein A33-like [Stegostoma tigrinum]|uniref:zinc-binding protein A33-like n=1 Tax=Stegostoma tigrinum TaxID=3053191 RepID=UPI00286FF4BC|nr:zinc-binding protein A33-like [Stegostoma tigrinum]